MANTTIRVNGQDYDVPVDANDPNVKILWVLREDLGLTGTKFGCGLAQCGACTVHLDGQPIRSCITPLSAAVGKEITTIEGLAPEGQLHPLQQAWIDQRAPQCGYCQSGQIMEAAALLAANPAATDEQIRDGMNGHLCRCGTYNRIFQAVKSVAQLG